MEPALGEIDYSEVSLRSKILIMFFLALIFYLLVCLINEVMPVLQGKLVFGWPYIYESFEGYGRYVPPINTIPEFFLELIALYFSFFSLVILTYHTYVKRILKGIFKKYGSQPIPLREKYPKISALIERFCYDLKIKTPESLLVETSEPFSMTFGKGKDVKLILTRGLIEKLSLPELKAVVLHELGHIVNKDVRLVSFFSVFMEVCKYYIFSLLFFGIYRNLKLFFFLTEIGWLLGKASSFVVSRLIFWFLPLFFGFYFIPLLLVNSIFRVRELYADARSALILGNIKYLKKALAKFVVYSTLIRSSFKLLFVTPQKMFKGFRYLIHTYFFSDHPPIEERISALNEGKYLKKDITYDLETFLYNSIMVSFVTMTLLSSVPSLLFTFLSLPTDESFWRSWVHFYFIMEIVIPSLLFLILEIQILKRKSLRKHMRNLLLGYACYAAIFSAFLWLDHNAQRMARSPFIGRLIHRDEPIYWVFAFLNTYVEPVSRMVYEFLDLCPYFEPLDRIIVIDVIFLLFSLLQLSLARLIYYAWEKWKERKER